MENKNAGYTTEAIRESLVKILPQKLKEYRNKAGLTMYDVGKILEKNQSTVAFWETGRTIPDIPTLLQLCNLYKIPDASVFLENVSQSDFKDITRAERELIKLWRCSKPHIRAAVKTLLKECNEKEGNA